MGKPAVPKDEPTIRETIMGLKCPHCTISIGTITTHDGIYPVAGSVLLCSDCGNLFMFSADLSELLKLTPAQEAEQNAKPAVVDMKMQWMNWIMKQRHESVIH